MGDGGDLGPHRGRPTQKSDPLHAVKIHFDVRRTPGRDPCDGESDRPQARRRIISQNSLPPGIVHARQDGKNEQERLDAGVIEPATSEWAIPVVFVPKHDGTVRFCVEYRKLNLTTVVDTYPLPRMDDFIDRLVDANVFSSLDANYGYWKIPIAPHDWHKNCFTTQMGCTITRELSLG